jgi:hypothetical protein
MTLRREEGTGDGGKKRDGVLWSLNGREREMQMELREGGEFFELSWISLF